MTALWLTAISEQTNGVVEFDASVPRGSVLLIDVRRRSRGLFHYHFVQPNESPENTNVYISYLT